MDKEEGKWQKEQGWRKILVSPCPDKKADSINKKMSALWDRAAKKGEHISILNTRSHENREKRGGWE